MPKPKTHWCTECGTQFSSPMMKRLYQRNDEGKFIPTGWICPMCNHMTSDAADDIVRLTRATEIKRIMTEEETDYDPCEGCAVWEKCPGVIGDKYCKAHRKQAE